MMRTVRCLISNVQEADFESIKELWMDDRVRQYLGGAIKDDAPIQAKFINLLERSTQPGVHFLSIRLVATGDFIGLMSLDKYYNGKDLEISYEFLPAYWGKGYAIEAVSRLCKFAFEDLGQQRLYAETQLANTRSCLMLEKVGMLLTEKVNRFGAEQAVYCLKQSEKA